MISPIVTSHTTMDHVARAVWASRSRREGRSSEVRCPDDESFIDLAQSRRVPPFGRKAIVGFDP